MQWLDTTAVAAGATGVEAMSVAHAVIPGAGAGGPSVLGTPAVAPEAPENGPVMIAPAAGQLYLPCTADPELFFAESPEDVEFAKALCRDCPVRLTCFAGAMERREPWGVWGGELFLRGEVVPRKRPRGRPRKTEVAA
jgi:WhiB family redox-sensing transcriptional regulator